MGVLAWRAQVQPDRVALGVDGVSELTFAQWWAKAQAVAAGLGAAGITPGDRVALVFGHRQWADLAVAYIGAQLSGAVAVPMSDRQAAARLDHAITHAGCRAAVTATTDRPGPWAVEVPHLGLDQLVTTDHRSSRPAPSGDGLAQILYTSGTSGRPKGVGASHDNLAAGFRFDLRRMALRHSEVAVHSFAIGTNAAQTMLANALTAHPTVLAPSRPSAGRLARLIVDRRAGSVFLVPATAIELLRSGALEGHDLSSVHLVGSTAAHLPPAVAADLARTFPRATIVNTYTSTEAAPAGTTVFYDPAKRSSLGRPLPGTVQIRTASGEVLGPDQVGEVWLHSPQTRSYIDDRKATAATFQQGWVRMGDLGRLDPDGHLYLVDRESDLVKTGAFKVSTLEVEAALHEHPDVAATAVVGLPDPVLGAVLGAAVIPRPGAVVSLSDLRSFLTGRLSDHELPARLIVVDDLPRNAGGKVVKRDLVDRFPSSEPNPAERAPGGKVIT
jgi:acyl-CoA synthetase (AMP-forming)/AMP-acid ligase II